MRGRIASLAVLFAAVSFVSAASSSARGQHDSQGSTNQPHWFAIGDPMIVDVPVGFGTYPDADRSRAGTQVVVQVLWDPAGDTIRFATGLGGAIATAPDGGFTPLTTLAAGGRAFLWGAARGGRVRVWTPAFDSTHSLASVDPQLTCGRAASATTPLAGPFNAVIPKGVQPGGRTVSSPAVAFVYGNPTDPKHGVRITTREGVDLGRTTDGSTVAQGGFGLAGAVFAYGTTHGIPTLWTSELVGRSTDLIRTLFAPCSSGTTAPPPAIISIAPTSAVRGASVTLSGSGFGSTGLKVTVGGVAATVGTASDTSATFTVPAGAPLGPTTVQLTNAGGQSASIAFTVTFDGNVTPVVDAAHATSATIGAQGGSIVAGGTTLTVPPGALQDDETITVTPISSLGGVDVGQLLGGVQLEPQGLHFLVPATLSIPLPSGISPADVTGFGFDGTGSSFHLAPAKVSGNTIVLLISHFSGKGAVRLNPSTAILGYEPSPADEGAEQDIVKAEEAAVKNGTDPSAAIDAALSTWYQHLKVGLQSVDSVIENYELAVGEWQAWHGLVEFLGRDAEHAAENTEAQGLATNDAADEADLMLAACNGSRTDITTPLKPLVRLTSDLHTVPLAIETKTTSDGKQLPTVQNLVRACVHVKIDSVTHPPVFAAATAPPTIVAPNTITVDLHEEFWTGTIRHDLPVDIDVGDATQGAPVRVGSGTTTTGHLQVVDTAAAAGTAFLRVTANLQGDVEGVDENDFQPLVRDRIVFAPDITVAPGDHASLRVLLAGDGMANAAVTFSLAGNGSLASTSATTDASGAASVDYTASSDPAGGTDIVTASVDTGIGTSSAALKITVKGPVSVTVAPSAVTIQAGSTAQFTATVTNGTGKGVTWSAGGGSIDQNGLFTAGPTAGTFTVTATSRDDPTKSASASVTVQVEPLPTISWDGTFADGSAGGGFSGAVTDAPWGDPATDSPEVNDPAGEGTFSGGTSATCPDPSGGPTTNSGAADYAFTVDPDFAPFTPIDPPGTGATIEASGSADASASSPGSCSAFAGGQTDVKIGFEISGGTVNAHLSLSASGTGGIFDGPNFADVSVTLSGQFGVMNGITIHGANSDSREVDFTLGPGSYRVEFFVHVQANAFGGDLSNTIHAQGRIGVTLTP